MGKKTAITQKAEANTTPSQREAVEESAQKHSNGNRYEGDHSGGEADGGAEKGGPDREKAEQRQPPEATR